MQSKQNQTANSVRLCSILFDVVRLSSILFDLFDLFENRTHTKLDVRFCSISERDRTPVFDSVFVRFCSIRYAGLVLSPGGVL